MNAAEIEGRLRTALEAADGVAAAYLFGSVARGEATDASDVDVAVLLAIDPPPTVDGLRLDLEGDLELAVGKSVQLVVLNLAPADLVHRVLRDGRILLDRDRSARIRFEVRARNEFFDVEPILTLYRSAAAPSESMIAVVTKELALIETFVQELETLARPAEIETDMTHERFVEHTLQIAIQAAIDAASHVVSDERLGEPRTNRELFDLLSRAKVIPAELAGRLRAMAGFRNILVHGYQDVDRRIVRDAVESRLGDLLEFTEALRAWIASR